MLEPAIDYSIDPGNAELLKGIATLPAPDRRLALVAIAGKLGVTTLITLFAEFIGLANAVADNNRTLAEELLVTEGNVHPHTAEKINLPTILGALEGAIVADGINPEKLCHGCAYRLGTPANQSPSTAMDATYCAEVDGPAFFCHEDLDSRGQPTQGCRGFAQLRARRKAEVVDHG